MGFESDLSPRLAKEQSEAGAPAMGPCEVVLARKETPAVEVGYRRAPPRWESR